MTSESTPAAALRTAAYHGDFGEITRLLHEGVDANVWDKWGRTAMSLAARQGHVDVVRALIQAGAWVNPHEDYDTLETPLLAAAENGHLSIVELLISAGADPNLHVGVSQRTPDKYADNNGHSAVAEYLRQCMK